jgi:TfoX/Sxy family transcriptional regulator of competence genes
MAKAASSIPAEILVQYERLVATVPGVPRKGATVPYTSVNGNMFSYLSKEGVLALRLPAEARAEFLATYATSLTTAYGVVQKEYADVPPWLLADTEQLAPWFEQSYAYTAALKPKPTTRKKAGS